jgi:hypothetical protein
MAGSEISKTVVARYQGKVSRIYFRADAGFAGEAIAINLDIEPVERPETVLWVDPIHRDGAAK